MSRIAVPRCGPRRASSSSSCPCPASTTSTTRSPRSPPRLALGVGRERIGAALRVQAAFGRVETIEVAGKPVSILLIKNPAGANEVLRTLRAGGRRRRGSTSGSRLNDRIADGRDVSWIWDADFELLAGRVRRVDLRRHRAPRDGASAQVRGLADRTAIEVEPAIGASLDRARRGGRAATVRPAHLHRAARAAHAARRARPGEGVLAMSADGSKLRHARRRDVVWHDAECGGYAADLAALGASSPPPRGGPVLDLGCRHRPRRARTSPRAGHRVVARRRRRALVDELERARRERGLAVETASAPTSASLDLGATFALVARADAASPAARRPGGAAAASPASRATCAPGGARRCALVDEPWPPRPATSRAADARRPGGRRLGLLEPAARGRRSTTSAIVDAPLRQLVAPDGDLSESATTIRLDALAPTTLEARPRSWALSRAAAAEHRPDRGPRRLDRGLWRRRCDDGAARCSPSTRSR